MDERQRHVSWKEIAEHLGCTPRTAQRWEKEYRLPVFRIPGESCSRVFAYRDDLDDWVRSGNGGNVTFTGKPSELPSGEMLTELQATPGWPEQKSSASDQEDGLPGETRSLRTGLIFGGLLTLAVMVTGATWLLTGWSSSVHDRLLQVRSDGRILRGFSASSQELWRVELPGSLDTPDEIMPSASFLNRFPTQAIRDLDGDGRMEVLAVTGPDSNLQLAPWSLYCLGEDGSVRWKYEPGQSLQFANGSCDRNWVLCFDAVDLDGDSRQEVVVLSKNHRLYPAKVTLLDAQGQVRGEFINSGHLYFLNYKDLDDDGILELIVSACHNGYRQPCLFVLDIRKIAGSSPQPDYPEYNCLGNVPGPVRNYLLFPKDPVMARLSPIGALWPISVSSEGLIVRAHSGIVSPPIAGTLDYFLRPDLSLDHVEMSSSYEMLYRYLAASGALVQPFSHSVINSLEPIRYWDGERFVTTPTMNRRFRAPSFHTAYPSLQTSEMQP